MQQGMYIEWVDGQPKPAYREPFTKQNAIQANVAALSLPYRPIRVNGVCDPTCGDTRHTPCPRHGDYNPNEEAYENYSRMEVMYMRQADKAAWGDPDAMRNAEDRWLGKPRQETVTASITMTMQEWLDTLPAPQEAALVITDNAPQAVTVRDVTLSGCRKSETTDESSKSLHQSPSAPDKVTLLEGL